MSTDPLSPQPSDPGNVESSDDQPPADRETLASGLLNAVIRETIGVMSDQESLELVQEWFASQLTPPPLEVGACCTLVEFILGKRFRGWVVPVSHCEAIAERLMSDPYSRERLETLWAWAQRDE